MTQNTNAMGIADHTGHTATHVINLPIASHPNCTVRPSTSDTEILLQYKIAQASSQLTPALRHTPTPLSIGLAGSTV